MSYEELISNLAKDIHDATLWERRTTALVRRSYERLGMAPAFGRTSAEAYDDLAASLRARRGPVFKVVMATKRVRADVARRLQRDVVQRLQAPFYLLRLPVLRALVDG